MSLVIPRNYASSLRLSSLGVQNLKYLSVTGAHLIFDCLLSDCQLEVLHLDGCSLQEFPEQIYQFKKLQELYVDNCDLYGIPEDIYRLENLRKFDFRDMHKKIPDGLLKTNIEEMYLYPSSQYLENIEVLKKMPKLKMLTIEIHEPNDFEKIFLSLDSEFKWSFEKQGYLYIFERIG